MTKQSILALVFAIIALAGPMVAQALSPSTVTLVVSICGIVGAIAAHVASALQPNAAQVELMKAARLAHDVPSASAGVRAILAKAIPLPLIVLAMALVGCTASQVATIEGYVLAGLPIACDVVEVADPSAAGLICAILDDAGGIVRQLPTITGPADAIKAEAAKRPSLKAMMARKAAGR